MPRDSESREQATGKPASRRIDIHEGDEFDEARMATGAKQAAALPGWVP